MRRAVHLAVFALLASLIGDRPILHAQGRDTSPLACEPGACPLHPSAAADEPLLVEPGGRPTIT